MYVCVHMYVYMCVYVCVFYPYNNKLDNLTSFKLFWTGVPLRMIRLVALKEQTAFAVVVVLFFNLWPSSHTTKSIC